MPATKEIKTRRRDAEVIEAAIKVFSRRGYADSTVQDIADELGILKGSLYHYIDGKEDLLFRLLLETHEEVQGILDDVAAMSGLDTVERLREYVRRQVEYTARNPARMAIYYHDVDQLADARRKEIGAKRTVHERFVVALIKDAQKTGAADSRTDPHVLANYMFGSMIWVYRWFKPRGKLAVTELGETCADFVLSGIGVDPQ